MGTAIPLTLGCVACSSPGAEESEEKLAASPQNGGVLRLLQEAPESLDPAEAASVYESLPINQIFDGLVALDPSLNVVPALASTWTISRDGRTYHFHLRNGAVFQDGTPVTAEDVTYTFRRLLDPARKMRSSASSYLLVVEGAEDYAAGRRHDLPGIEAIDPQTVRIRLVRPYLSFLETLTMDGLRIVPEAVVERIGDAAFGKAPVGTGPFRLVSWNDVGYRLDANPRYFNGAPHLDGVEVLFGVRGEMDAGTERFYRGELDILEAPSDQLARLGRRSGVRIERYHELSLQFLGLLTVRPPLDDVRIRRAIAHAINREAIGVDSRGTRRPAIGILPPGLTGYSPEPKALTYDPEKARELLAEAGHPGGEGLAPIILYASTKSGESLRVLNRIRSDIEAIGLKLDLRQVRWSELSVRTEEHTAPAFLLGWVADLTDPDSFLRTLFESQGSANYFAFEDKETAALLEAGARETNPVVRARLYRDVERHVLELAPLVPLYHSVGVVAMRAGVHGFELSPMGVSYVDLEHVWLEQAGSKP